MKAKPLPTFNTKHMYLDINNLEISFQTPKGTFTAVRQVNLQVKKGEIISIIGHSGCGKSTILNAVAGMLTPSQGSVTIKGAAVKGPGPDRGIVFQNYSLLPWLSVYQNIFQAVDAAVKDKSREEKREITDYFIRTVGLAAHQEKLPKQISGGMKQRVAIARAFAINPDMLLLDEPFGALDALTKGEMHLELLRLWNLDHRSKTIILVTHDIEEAIFLSDRIVVMSNGPAATIREIEELHLPRPRNKKDIVGLPEYQMIRERLLSLLMDKVAIDAADFYQEAEVA